MEFLNNPKNQNEIIDVFTLLENHIIPESYPDVFSSYFCSEFPENYDRYTYTKKYGFSLVSMNWLRILKDKVIKDSKCLEIMAGSGMISKGLKDLGTDIIATDNHSWSKGNSEFFKNPWTDVINLSANDAITKYGKNVDFIIMSWPYMNDDAYHALMQMREINPNCIMIYIGESLGGCTANDKFFEELEFVESMEEIADEIDDCYSRWAGIYDSIYFIK